MGAPQCEMHLSKQAWAPALDAARRLTTIDPLREAGHQLLMRGLAGAGRRSDALRQYDELAHLLHKHLSVRPDADSEMLRQSIKNGPTAVTVAVRDCHAV